MIFISDDKRNRALRVALVVCIIAAPFRRALVWCYRGHVMGEPVEESAGHFVVAEDDGPFAGSF